MHERIRKIVAEHGRLPSPVSELADDADLYQAGLTSFASVQLMLALEDSFDIEFPPPMLNRRTFASIGAIAAAVMELVPQES